MKTRAASGVLKIVKYEEEELKGDDDDAGLAPTSDVDESGDEDLRPFKRRRKSDTRSISVSPSKKGTRKGNRGKLSKLLEMPIDIFCEISTHLEPLDLLRLARSTRDFNQLLMSRTSKPIWRTARSYYPELPDCPLDMSEPEYARLLFERDCHACLSSRAMKVDWVTRSRLCHRCRSSFILKGTQLMKTIPDLTEDLLECIPCRNNQWSHRTARHRRMEYFYSIRVEALVAKYRAAVPKGTRAEDARTIREKFVEHHKESIQIIIDHAKEVERWLLSDRLTKQVAASQAAARRKEKLRANLLELGYEESEFPTRDWEWIGIMDQPRDLTPRIWNAVRSKLEACIEIARKQRIEAARNERKAKRRSELWKYLSVFLTARSERDAQLRIRQQDAFSLPAVEALLSEDDYGRELTQTIWDTAQDQIEKDMDEYTEQVRKDLIQKIINSRSASTQCHEDHLKSGSKISSEVDLAYLLSPSTSFNCKNCTYPSLNWRYPKLLTHTHGWGSTWRSEDFDLNAAATSAAEAIILSLFEYNELEDRDSVDQKTFLCLGCDERVSTPMSWDELILHFEYEQEWYDRAKGNVSPCTKLHNTHDTSGLNDSTPPFVVILTAEEASKHKEKYRTLVRGKPTQFRCGLCSWTAARTKEEVVIHISRAHLKDSPDPCDISQT